jgi:hypothetical protein
MCYISDADLYSFKKSWIVSWEGGLNATGGRLSIYTIKKQPQEQMPTIEYPPLLVSMVLMLVMLPLLLLLLDHSTRFAPIRHPFQRLYRFLL